MGTPADGPTFPIEHNVPIPPKRSGGRKRRFPFHEMRPGDSFLVPTTSPAEQRLVRQRLAAYGVQTLGKGAVTTRTVPRGVRVWRVK